MIKRIVILTIINAIMVLTGVRQAKAGGITIPVQSPAITRESGAIYWLKRFGGIRTEQFIEETDWWWLLMLLTVPVFLIIRRELENQDDTSYGRISGVKGGRSVRRAKSARQRPVRKSNRR
ncbi:hypothetical protein A2Z33_06395 [Candidatus Gottesmanbacteria bacterium RBG_16_52_11]|uniref:Uncharacterized protein n=1 Tax=Candidatus Gottesmanbacteria bacterium RBG_16_52_11 TaxID=1798374 RepID=A0A1F5YXH1_9BACT|nr:MAG: hypothetical protein A2Z33_06395 [Candidatus Gottesmanbacteria bacterium RBG_16_52_11]